MTLETGLRSIPENWDEKQTRMKRILYSCGRGRGFTRNKIEEELPSASTKSAFTMQKTRSITTSKTTTKTSTITTTTNVQQQQKPPQQQHLRQQQQQAEEEKYLTLFIYTFKCLPGRGE